MDKDRKYELRRWVKEKALELGFGACGIAGAGNLKDEGERLDAWLANGYHGEMGYMTRHREMRTEPARLVEGARSVISVLMSYRPSSLLETDDNYLISTYAYGRDYHEVIRGKMNDLLEMIRQKAGDMKARAFTDSAPVLDRAWAARSGLGWIGKNSCLIHPKLGSFVFIGEIITSLELPADEDRVNDLCGGCTRCIDQCPTGAITSPRVVDSRKCISYLTIEYRGEIPPGFRERMNGWIFGCDICQDVCPWNRKAPSHNHEDLLPSDELRAMRKEDWDRMDEEAFSRLFRGSAVERAGYRGLKRNIRFVSDDV